MPNRALTTARSLTVSVVAATALGTAALGLHLATDHQAAQAVGAVQQPLLPVPDVAPVAPQDPGSNGGGGFTEVAPPLGGGGAPLTTTNGS
jgi:hypothetical protein